MSIEAQMTQTASVQNPASPSVSSTGVVTAAWGDATSVKCALFPGVPAAAQRAFGVEADIDAVAYFPAGTDIRPDNAESNALGSKVTISSVVYTCVGAQNPGLKGRFILAALRRSA